MFSFSSNINTHIDYMCTVREHLWSDLAPSLAAFLQVTKNVIIGILGPAKQHFINICMYFIPAHIKHMFKWNFVLWCILSVSLRCCSRRQHNWISRNPWPIIEKSPWSLDRVPLIGLWPTHILQFKHITTCICSTFTSCLSPGRFVCLCTWNPQIRLCFKLRVFNLWPDYFPEYFKRTSCVVRHYSLNVVQRMRCFLIWIIIFHKGRNLKSFKIISQP